MHTTRVRARAVFAYTLPKVHINDVPSVKSRQKRCQCVQTASPLITAIATANDCIGKSTRKHVPKNEGMGGIVLTLKYFELKRNMSLAFFVPLIVMMNANYISKREVKQIWRKYNCCDYDNCLIPVEEFMGLNCTKDDECDSKSWCRIVNSTESEPTYRCVPFVDEGEECERYALPEERQRCPPDTVCKRPTRMAEDVGGNVRLRLLLPRRAQL